MTIAVLPLFIFVWLKRNVLCTIGVFMHVYRSEQWEKLVLARVSETRHIFPLGHLAATSLVGYAPTSDSDAPSCMPRWRWKATAHRRHGLQLMLVDGIID